MGNRIIAGILTVSVAFGTACSNNSSDPAASTVTTPPPAELNHRTVSQRIVDGGFSVCDELFESNDAVADAFERAAIANGATAITSIFDGQRSPGANPSPDLDELVISCEYGPVYLVAILWENGDDPVCGHPAACLPNRVGDLEFWDQYIELGFDVDAGYGLWYSTNNPELAPTDQATAGWLNRLNG